MTILVNRRGFIGLTAMAVAERDVVIADEPKTLLASSILGPDPSNRSVGRIGQLLTDLQLFRHTT